jgi:mRNA interferase RelE/StbE
LSDPYELRIDRRALKEIAGLSKAMQGRIMKALATLRHVPRPVGATKLEGVDDAYRIRVGDYRVIYRIRDKILTVTVVRVGHRRDVYR